MKGIQAHLPESLRHAYETQKLEEAAKRPIEGLDRVTRFSFNIAPGPEDNEEIRPVRELPPKIAFPPA